MSPRLDPRRRCLPVAEWPALDRQAWMAGLPGRERRRFSESTRAVRLGPVALDKAEKGWGRFLTFLDLRGDLDRGVGPAARPTRERIAAFLDEMIELGNADHTITGRLQELTDALRVMAPGEDFRWIQAPDGVPIRTLLDMRKRDLVVYHPRVLFEWGVRLMEEAVAMRAPCRRRVRLRDGLMIAVLASRAPRRRSMQIMELGHQLRHDGEGWWITLGRKDVKTRKPLEYPVPKTLWPWVERYLHTERRELLGGTVSDALWIGSHVEPLRAPATRIFEQSAREFGRDKRFGPHRFRYGIATYGPRELPDSPGVTTKILGITPDIEGEHYDRGDQVAAAHDFHDALAEERRRTSVLARRIREERRQRRSAPDPGSAENRR
ncbi:phage integrase family protein [Roseomonas sp. HF4]|uniref:phage integrase family protein n=1 Tax=Roseomonas sp. HF4 TaxID=2562313 RepID=UPI0010C135AD|nr:phage integrase family protein [Roseomonas sp. HF4]